MTPVVLVASYLEPEYVEQIRRVDDRLEVLYEPSLLPAPQFPADHKGAPHTRSPAEESRWRALLARAEILFDFDRSHGVDLPFVAPHVAWVQATSSGIGEYVRRMGYARSMPKTVFTTAAGVHAQPLAEFCLMVMLAFRKRLPQLLRDQQRKHWERFATTDLRGRTLVIVGMGQVGREVARLAQALGMHVVGVKRTVAGVRATDLHLDALLSPEELPQALGMAEHLVLIAPHTEETDQMISARELAMLPVGAVFINMGRGALVDEPALVAALQSGRLAGAGLDVFAEEPLPAESPLWDMPNVIVSPHSASTSDRENGRITELFCANLERYLAGRPLLNQLQLERGY